MASQREALKGHALGLHPVALRTRHFADQLERDREVAQGLGRAAQALDELARQREAFAVNALGPHQVALRARHIAELVERDREVAQRGGGVVRCLAGKAAARQRQGLARHALGVAQPAGLQQFGSRAPRQGQVSRTRPICCAANARPLAVSRQRGLTVNWRHRQGRRGIGGEVRGRSRLRCTQFLAQRAHVPDVWRNRAHLGPEVRRQEQHQGSVHVALEQEAPLVQARQVQAPSAVPCLIAGMPLRAEPERAGLRRQLGHARHQVVDGGFRLVYESVIRHRSRERLAVENQALVEPIGQLHRHADIGKNEDQRKTLGLPLQMAQQVDRGALGRRVKL